MAHFVFKVSDVFSIRGRGIILVSDPPLMQWQCPYRVRGARIELRRPGLPPVQTKVDAVPMSQPNLDILIRYSSGLSKADVLIGTEVWLIDEDAKG